MPDGALMTVGIRQIIDSCLQITVTAAARAELDGVMDLFFSPAHDGMRAELDAHQTIRRLNRCGIHLPPPQCKLHLLFSKKRVDGVVLIQIFDAESLEADNDIPRLDS